MAKIVVHVDDVEKVQMAFSNVQNLLTDLPTSEIFMVINGPAVTTLTSTSWNQFMTANPQVEVDACKNALASHHVPTAELNAQIKVVPSGVVRLVELEEQGAIYIRP